MGHLVACTALLLSACATAPNEAVPRQSQIADLNHVFATVDPITAEAIRSSEFLRRFANLEVRTTTGTRASWTGRYLYGKRTYIEFFAPQDFAINDKPAPIGTWGIALSGDTVGVNDALAARLKAAGHKSVAEVDTKKLGTKNVPWFEALTAVSRYGDSGALGETVSVWAMEYRPSYLDIPEVGKEPAEGPHDAISRERYQSDVYATKMMRDLVYAHFNIGDEDFARIEPLLKAAGYRTSRSGSDIIARGNDADFRFSLTAPADQGLRQVRFSLNAPARRHTEVLGHSTLMLGPGANATWNFGTPR